MEAEVGREQGGGIGGERRREVEEEGVDVGELRRRRGGCVRGGEVGGEEEEKAERGRLGGEDAGEGEADAARVEEQRAWDERQEAGLEARGAEHGGCRAGGGVGDGHRRRGEIGFGAGADVSGEAARRREHCGDPRRAAAAGEESGDGEENVVVS